MPKILKARRVHNPKRRKRKMTAKQLKYFGSKRQRAALKNRKRRKSRVTNRKRRRTNFPARSRILSWSRGRGKAQQVKRHRNRGRKRARRKRTANVGEILSASLSGLNPGRRKKVARRRKRHNAGHRRRSRARVHHRRRHRRSNPRVVVRYRTRGRRHNRRRGRRNPGKFFSGKFGKVFGVLGGAAVTAIASNTLIPAQFSTGIIGYFATGLVAFAQGKVIGKVTKNSALGDDMVIGGLAYVAIKVISDMLPSVAGFLPFSLRGMGLIGPSSFYTPQVNMPGSMSSFVTPAAIAAAMPAPAMHGLGATRGRRVGRMGY